MPSSGWPWSRSLLLAALALLALCLPGVLVLFEWRPEQIEPTPIRGHADTSLSLPASLELLSWNIGYAGLGKDADFFMDGGTRVRPSGRMEVEQNLAAIRAYLEGQSADLVLLQEVDTRSSRTYGTDQVETLTAALPDRPFARALNFKVPWVPYPLLRPIGKVESGLLSASRFPLLAALRHQLPGSYPWPVRVFHLKRCLHEVRVAAADGRDWVVLHLHLSAFDKGGHLRKQQMDYLRQLILRLGEQGHHVVVGGDWNQAFPGVTASTFPRPAPTPGWFCMVPEGWTPEGWQWAFDPEIPSLRATNRPYKPGESFVTVVDGFLLDPELDLIEVHTEDLGFRHSDHNPVHLKVRLAGHRARRFHSRQSPMRSARTKPP